MVRERDDDRVGRAVTMPGHDEVSLHAPRGHPLTVALAAGRDRRVDLRSMRSTSHLRRELDKSVQLVPTRGLGARDNEQGFLSGL